MLFCSVRLLLHEKTGIFKSVLHFYYSFFVCQGSIWCFSSLWHCIMSYLAMLAGTFLGDFFVVYSLVNQMLATYVMWYSFLICSSSCRLKSFGGCFFVATRSTNITFLKNILSKLCSIELYHSPQNLTNWHIAVPFVHPILVFFWHFFLSGN